MPCGGLYSTSADLAKLYQMMLNEGELGGKRILKPESVKQMTTTQTDNPAAAFGPGCGFGLGWVVVAKPQGATSMLSPGSYGHPGAFGTNGWVDPHQDVLVTLPIERQGLEYKEESAMRKELQRRAVAAIKKP